MRTHFDWTDARRAEHLHFISQVVERQDLLDSDPQCLVTHKPYQTFPLAESRAFGVARPDARRIQCPNQTLGEGKGEDGWQRATCHVAMLQEPQKVADLITEAAKKVKTATK